MSRASVGEDCEGFATPASFSYASSPSEIMSSINSINLAESIAKHKQWATQAAAATAAAAAAAPAGQAAAAAAATAAVGAATDAHVGSDYEPQLAVC
jgi:hypothetical protein